MCKPKALVIESSRGCMPVCKNFKWELNSQLCRSVLLPLSKLTAKRLDDNVEKLW